MGENEISIGLTNDKLTVDGNLIISSYEVNDTTGAIDITNDFLIMV